MTIDVAPTFEVVCEDTSRLERADWLSLRRGGIGSSDAAPALGLSPWKSQYALWAEKTGQLEDEDERDRFIIGREFEPTILRLWAEREGFDLTGVRRNLMVRSRAHPFMLANPDGLTDDAVVEVKTCSEFDEPRWADGIPDQYVIQGLHLMVATGRRRCVYPVMFGFNFPTTFEVEWNQKTAEAMVTVEAEMWRRIQENDAPDPDGSDSSFAALREVYFSRVQARSVELPDAALRVVQQRDVAVAAMKPHQDAIDTSKALLMKFLGDAGAEVGMWAGEVVCTWKANKNGVRSFRFADAGRG